MQEQLRLTSPAWQRIYARHDPHRSAISLRTRLRFSLNARWHSTILKIQDASHAEAIKVAVPQPPIFLLGFWRSGTTLLHELISSNPRYGFPSTYACLNPSHFLLSEQWLKNQELKQARRPMDDVKYTWTSPQEDEFALLCMGAPSPYEAVIMPSLLRDASALVEFGKLPADAQERWKTTLQQFLRYLTVQQKKPMVLKSPPHGFRLSALISMFPDARYILIDRNPYEVFASNLKLWRVLTDLYGLEPALPDEIEEFVLRAYTLHEDAIAAGRRLSKPGTFATVRYEDLLVDAAGQVERLYAELDLGGFNEAEPYLKKYMASVAGHKRNRFQFSNAQKQRVETAWGQIIDRKGYSWSDEYLTVVA